MVFGGFVKNRVNYVEKVENKHNTTVKLIVKIEQF